MSSPAVSVVVPLYNKEREVTRALQSVLAQTAQDFEIIVVDDGSTDQGPAIVEGIGDGRIRLIRQANGGVSVARNRGVAEARSDLIAFLDADDEWMPDFLETICRLRRAYPQAGAYATSYFIEQAPGKQRAFRSRHIPAPPWEGIVSDYFRCRIGTVWSSAVAVPRAVLAKAGGFPPGVRLAEDLDTWMRIAAHYPLAYSSRPLAIWHCQASNRASDRHVPEWVSPLRKSYAVMKADPSLSSQLKSDIRRYVGRAELSNIMQRHRCGLIRQTGDVLRQWRREYGSSWRWLACTLIAQAGNVVSLLGMRKGSHD